MSAASNTLRLILIGEDKSASSSVKGVGSELDKSSKKMQTFHKVGRAAGIALAGGLVIAGKAAFDMTKRAAEDQQAASRLAQTIHKTTGATKEQQGAVEDWITAQGKATGVTDDELRPALSKLVVATHSVGKAQKLAGLAMDVSAGSGKSLESVSFALAKAQNGNISGLSRLGVATKDADGKTKSLTAITKDLANTYGGAAARNAETAAGKQKILSTQYGELQEQIGAQLLPVMSKLLTIGLKVVNWISHNTTLVGVLVGVFGTLAAGIWAITAATAAWNAVLALNPIGLVVVALIALGVGLVIAYKKSETFRNIVNASFHAISATVGFVVGFIKAHWAPLFAILGGPIGLAAVIIIKNFDKVQAGIRVLGHWAQWLWNNAFAPALKFIVNGISFLLNVWGHMLVALGHVPGFGWATAAGHALEDAANKAQALADHINRIPKRTDIAVITTFTTRGSVHGTGGHTVPGFARGTMSAPGGLALVGEKGPELINLPRGSRVYPHGTGPGGGVNVTVNASGLVNPQSMAREIHSELLKLKKQGFGGNALGLT